MGFVRLSHGEIAILGQPVHRALRQNLVAYVPQSEDVDWTFPVLVEDVVMMGRYGHMGWLRRAKVHDREVVDAALARVGMSDYRHRQIGELSGGQKNGCSLPVPSLSRARSFCWMSRLPALTSRPKPRSSPAARAARRWLYPAGFDPQSRFGQRVLRLHGDGQRHRVGQRTDGNNLYRCQPRTRFQRRAAPRGAQRRRRADYHRR